MIFEENTRGYLIKMTLAVSVSTIEMWLLLYYSSNIILDCK